MIKWSFIISALSAVVLFAPDWRPPYTYLDNLIILLSMFGVVGPWFLILALVLNRLLNISFRNRRTRNTNWLEKDGLLKGTRTHAIHPHR